MAHFTADLLNEKNDETGPILSLCLPSSFPFFPPKHQPFRTNSFKSICDMGMFFFILLSRMQFIGREDKKGRTRHHDSRLIESSLNCLDVRCRRSTILNGRLDRFLGWMLRWYASISFDQLDKLSARRSQLLRVIVVFFSFIIVW